ncbi:hypothetical protein RR46_14774 [Papilio xuthus]|uniref:Uncharacterized protein n=1 Tax=Papilio xuthus TaxID=66420 RepID=A0A194PJK7_PAPXU|nr:hypothetical protein RR46_14774 [Papilio xuthus]
MKKNVKSKPLFVIQCYEDRQPTLQIKKEKPEPVPQESPVSNGVKQHKDVVDCPPPPPPMPIANGHQNGETKKVEILKPKSEKVDHIINTNVKKVGTLKRTPTPDYNNKADTQLQYNLKNIKEENAEIESLESYKLKNPLNVQPKPPPNYFVRAPNGTATMKKIARPVSVTIGEYVNNVGRREPLKLDFLNGDKVDGHLIPDDESILSRLQSELALTLSRSNLRKKTEALDKNVKMSVNKAVHKKEIISLDKNFHVRYGNNILPLPPSIRIPKVSKTKH